MCYFQVMSRLLLPKLFAICLFLEMLPHIALKAQNAQWFFGTAGIDFSTPTPTPLTSSAMSTYEGCATVCDADGQLLFYTDGVSVWNRLHTLMPGGTGLFGDISSSNSAVIVPQPGNPNSYFIFTTECYYPLTGLHYTRVDMCLDGGLGAVVAAEKNVFLTGQTPEKVTTGLHANGRDVWVVTHGWNNNQFLSYVVTPAGVNPVPVTSNVGPNHGPDFFMSVGCMKMNPDNNKLALAVEISGNRLELYDFDNSTGIVSNPVVVPTPHFAAGLGFGNTLYGCEFSPDSKYIYTSSWYDDNIYQMDISSWDAAVIEASAIVIGTTDAMSNVGALQLGPDGKIYCATQFQNSVGIIENPNAGGIACNYVDAAFDLAGETVYAGLPSYVQNNQISYIPTIITEPACAESPFGFSIIGEATYDAVNWDFGDPGTTTDNSTDFITTYTYAASGNYTVTCVYTIGCFTDTVELEVTVSAGGSNISLPEDTTACIETFSGFTLTIDDALENILWNTGDTTASVFIGEAGTFIVSAVDACGAIVEDSINVQLITCDTLFDDTLSVSECIPALPNAFSPNGDGINDIFKVIQNNNCIPAQYSLHIYNRWGTLVFVSENADTGWDGRYQNKEQEIGTYVYYLRSADQNHSTTRTGSVTLIR